MLVFLYMVHEMTLLDTAFRLNSQLENSYLALACVLSDIQEQFSETETWKDNEYNDFVDFYTRGLGREKSTVSRLLTAGRWLRENGYADKLPSGQLSYKRLVQSIKENPGKTPTQIIGYAQVWSDKDFSDEKKDQCKHPKPSVLVCPDCWKKMEK